MSIFNLVRFTFRSALPAALLLAMLFGNGSFLWAQNPASESTVEENRSSPFLKPGIVVEKVMKDSDAEKAGLREGDILLSWARGEERGTLETPLDLDWLEIEQAPRGTLLIAGLRQGLQQIWQLHESIMYLGTDDFWGMQLRPNLAGGLKHQYEAGKRLAAAGMLGKGISRWQLAASAVSTSPPKWLSTWFSFHAARAAAKARKSKEAYALFEHSLQDSTGVEAWFRADILRAWAYSVAIDKDWSLLGPLYARALAEDSKACNQCLAVATDTASLGGFALFHAELAKGYDLMKQALEIEIKLAPRSLRVVGRLNSLSGIAIQLWDPLLAEKYSAEALAIEKTIPNRVGAANAFTLTNLAGAAWYRGDLSKAEQYSSEAILIFKRVPGGLLFASSAYSILGLVAQSRGDLENSEKYLLKALQSRGDGPTFGRAVDLMNLGISLREQHKRNRAQSCFKQALAIIQTVSPGSYYEAAILNSLAVNAERRGDLGAAETYLDQAIAINQRAGSTIHSNFIFTDLGRILEEQGRLDEAKYYYDLALERQGKLSTGSKEYAEILLALAHLSRQKSDAAAAAEYYERAQYALENQATRLGGSEDVRSGFRSRYERAYREYIDLLLTQNKPALAFETLERSQSRTLLETLSAAHADIHTGVDPALLGRERMLQVEMKAKSERRVHLLGEKNSEEQVKAIEKEIGDLNSEYQEIEGRIRSTSPAYAALTQPQPLKAKEIQEQLLDHDTLLLEYSLGEERSYVFAVTPGSLQAFQLPKRAEIEKTAKQVYRLLTARNRTIASEAAAQRQARLARAEAAYPQAAARLSQMILGPVTSQLLNKRLLVVADGALQYIPFALLLEPNAEQSAAPVPLVVNHEIVHLPSASVLAVLRQEQMNRKPAPKAVAVLADPVFDKQDSRVAARNRSGSSPVQTVAVRGATAASAGTAGKESIKDHDWLLPNLPSTSSGLLTRSAADVGLSRDGQLRLPRLRFSRQEAAEIMAVTPQGEGMEAIDFAANRAAATSPELGQYRIVHFATHGLLDSEHPELSGLVLSLVDKKGKPQDGFLTLSDIYNLNLPADLVVLSACETGLGKEISGEGLIGLTRGFMYAGASRVVASLWKVSDAATAQLMAEFYRAMEKDGMAPAAALRAAQVKMWKQKRWSSPYYWAAFEIQGEWK